MNTLPHDAALPQLATALDGAAMAGAFAERLRPHGLWVEGCTVERVKYRPGRNATLAYRLRLHAAGQPPFEQRVAARLCSGDGAKRAAEAAARATTPSRCGPATLWLPALDLVAWCWPNDAKLRAPLALAGASARQMPALPPLLAAIGAGADTRAEVEVVQYVPEHRLTACVDLDWRDSAGAHTRRVYAKSSREPGGAAAHALLAQLQASDAWRAGRLRTPRALLWDAACDLHWQQALRGVPLAESIAAPASACMAALGAQLAALHATPLTASRMVTPADLHDRPAQVARALAPIVGAAGVERAAAAIDAGRHVLDSAPPATLHGDLHAGNILVEDGAGGPRVALVDLDGLRRGPALIELGGWIAESICRALLDGAAAERDRAAWRALIDAYVAAGGLRPDPRALAWATAWNLLAVRTWRCVVNLKPGRFALAPRLVALAAELAAARGPATELVAC